MRRGFLLRAYLLASHLLPLFAGRLLRKRLERGKEHPTRWVEKMGLALAPRPEGPVVWVHAVGLGEVLSLRGLIDRMGRERPDLSFIVTSTTKASAAALAGQLPARTVHQFLPIDAPRYRARFLDHHRPDLCIWAEQDLWPGFVSDLDARGTPQCIIAARMNATSHQKHQRAASLYRDLYGAMAFVTAQDTDTAAHLTKLGAEVEVTGSLKPAAPALTCDQQALDKLITHLDGRFVWAVAPAHPNDTGLAQEAHSIVRQTVPDALLIIAPRFLDQPADPDLPRRSQGQLPARNDPVWLFDTFGELGLVYRLAQIALIGGTFSDIEGHNPWEAVALETAVIHGPRTANFPNDYVQLQDASFPVQSATQIAAAVLSPQKRQIIARAATQLAKASQSTDAIAHRLVGLVGG